MTDTPRTEHDRATFGGGCFWCIEAVFARVRGVESVQSGYMGGAHPNPSYEAVCTGRTGHAEVVHITFDPAVVAYRDLLEIFFSTHDPTTLNRQGHDVGTQYRSVIFFHSPAQEDAAKTTVAALESDRRFHAPIVTEITPAGVLYPAEDYHQNYFAQNPTQPYCTFHIAPKLDAFTRQFPSKLKP